MDQNNNDHRDPILQHKLGGYQPRTAHYVARGMSVAPKQEAPTQTQQPVTPQPVQQIRVQIIESPPTVLPERPVVALPPPPRPQEVPLQVTPQPVSRPAEKTSKDVISTPRPQHVRQHRPAPAYIFDDIEIEDAQQPRKRGGFAKLAAAFSLIIVLAAAGYGGWLHRDNLTSMASGLISRQDDPSEVLAKKETKSADSIEAVSISDDDLSKHRVPAAAPRFISIPQLLVKARVIGVNFSPEAGLEVPANVYDAGWVQNSMQPGKEGAVLIDGLGAGINENAIFRDINTLQPGSIIEIENGEGTKFRYTVKSTELFENGNLNLEKIRQPYEPGKKGLNIMSCSGSTTSPNDVCAKLHVVYSLEI